MVILGYIRYLRPCLRNKTQCEHRYRGTLKLPRGRATSGLPVCLARPSYLVDACLSAGEGEREAQRQLGALEAHIVQEVSDTLYDVVKELQERERRSYEGCTDGRCAPMGAAAGTRPKHSPPRQCPA